MPTVQLFSEDTYQDSVAAQVRAVGIDDRGPFAVFDKTVFYPQGGGQPADRGFVSTPAEELLVSDVRFVEGDIRHYVNSAPDSLVGSRAELRIDRDRRLLHAALHTGGHLIAQTIEDICPRVWAIKGHHFPGEAYVEFDGDIDSLSEDALMEASTRAQSLIGDDLPVIAEYMTADQLREKCDRLPPGLPSEKPLRAVSLGDHAPVPCGGTHVSSLRHLAEYSIDGMKRRKGHAKIKYSCTFASD